jgi:hypothetical protein
MKIYSKTCLTHNGYVYSNEEVICSIENDNLISGIEYLKLEYPKFYKMDPLSQIAFLLAELLLKKEPIEKESGIFIWNKESSIIADLKHIKNINEGNSGPANFTYTLPNIMLGELTIRHKIYGETGVFICNDPPDFDLIIKTIEAYMQETGEERVLAGWINAFDKNIGFLCDIRKSINNESVKSQLKSLYEFINL